MLKSLYETGLISQYIYLDMNHQLDMVQETLRLGESRSRGPDSEPEQSLFQRLEESVLHAGTQRLVDGPEIDMAQIAA